jgi:hypothetical protein
MADGHRAERSLGELFHELSQDTSALIRQEMALARTEVSERISAFARDASMIGAGGVLLHVALLAVTAAIIMGLVCRHGCRPSSLRPCSAWSAACSSPAAERP